MDGRRDDPDHEERDSSRNARNAPLQTAGGAGSQGVFRHKAAVRRLSELARLIGARFSADGIVSGLSLDSRRVRPGDLFVALPGTRKDGRAFVADARRRGAAGIVASGPVDDGPTVEVDDPHAAASQIAAALHDFPALRLQLAGITGTLGKTSAAFFLRDIMAAHGDQLGVIGSLGVQLGDDVMETGMTTPDAPILQEALHSFADRGARCAAMEVTSHALLQHRIEGLCFAVGLLTNLVPDEHLEFHPTPEHYLEAKTRFFDYLADSAPLVVNADDELARAHTRQLKQPVVDVSASPDRPAEVLIENLHSDGSGSEFTLRIARPLPGIGTVVLPQSIPVRLPLLGLPQVMNCSLSATVALLLGAGPDAVAAGIGAARPIRRRIQVVRRAAPMIIDDSTGNPRSLRAVLQTARMLEIAGETRVVLAIRGKRGCKINTALAAALAEEIGDFPVRLVITSSEDAAGPRDRVQSEERECFLDTLSAAGIPFDYEPTLGIAIEIAINEMSCDDLVLLLGAQGMDRAAAILLDRLAETPPHSGR